MRVHTACGTVPTLALAPGPTAAGLAGNRIRGSAPAGGAGASRVLSGGVACGGDDVRGALVLDALVGEGGSEVGFGILPAPDAVYVMAEVGPAGDVRGLLGTASVAAGAPAPQPARRRQVRVPAVLLRDMVRSVRSASPGGRIMPRRGSSEVGIRRPASRLSSIGPS